MWRVGCRGRLSFTNVVILLALVTLYPEGWLFHQILGAVQRHIAVS